MNQIPNIEEWKKLAKEILAPNVTYIDPKFKEVASWAEELLNAFWVEQQKDLDAFIDTLHQQLQKARQSLHTSLVAAVEGKKEDGDTPFGTQELHETELAYNQALTDTLNIINNIFKE